MNANMWGPDKSKPKSLLSYLLHLLGFVNLSGYIFIYLLRLVQKKSKLLLLNTLKTIIHMNSEQRHIQTFCEKQ